MTDEEVAKWREEWERTATASNELLIERTPLVRQLRAEVARLRAALNDCIHGRRDWMEKAKAALEPKP
jgi:hypothetical protein